MTGPLDRRLGLVGSVAVGMSAMIGAGLFVVFPPAVSAAGDGLMISLTVAAIVAGVVVVSVGPLTYFIRRPPTP